MTTNATATTNPTVDSSLKLHVSLDVQDLEKSIKFYSVLFDMRPTKLRPGYAKFDAAYPPVNLALNERAHCCVQGLSHMGIRVPDIAEVAATKARLNAAGFATEDEMGSTCCSALQDKVWVADPTGFKWEIYVFKGDLPATDSAQRTAAPAISQACCR
jgi:catechol 2,3-dioxygenase-like lactoylglutathione lyase family enzyme